MKTVLPFLNETSGPIERFHLVNMGAADKSCTLAVDGSKPIIGAADLGCQSVDDTLGIQIAGTPCRVSVGASVVPGDWLTADADSKAIPATASDYSFGYALQSGEPGEYIEYVPHQAKMPA